MSLKIVSEDSLLSFQAIGQGGRIKVILEAFLEAWWEENHAARELLRPVADLPEVTSSVQISASLGGVFPPKNRYLCLQSSRVKMQRMLLIVLS